MIRFRFSLLANIKKYKGSNTHERLHDWKSSQQKVDKIKQNIDYQFIHKYSNGKVIIREFLFREKKSGIKVNHLHNYAVPNGKWTLQEYLANDAKDYGKVERQIKEAVTYYDDELKEKFNKYYEKNGRKGYTFAVKEQLDKIGSMSENDFQKFLDVMKSE